MFAVRNWTSQDIPDTVLEQVLEAGRWAPSPLNSQAWTFIVIRNKEPSPAFSFSKPS